MFPHFLLFTWKSFLFLSSILLVIDFNFLLSPSRIQFHFWKLDSFLHGVFCFLINDFHLCIKDVINDSQSAFPVLIELNYKVDFLFVVLDSRWWTSLNGNVQSKVSSLEVIRLDGYSIGVDDFLTYIIVVIILWIRDSTDSVFEGDFLLMIFDGDDGFFEWEVVFFSEEIDNTKWWGSLNWEWDLSDLDVIFVWFGLLSHFLNVYKIQINIKRLIEFVYFLVLLNKNKINYKMWAVYGCKRGKIMTDFTNLTSYLLLWPWCA